MLSFAKIILSATLFVAVASKSVDFQKESEDFSAYNPFYRPETVVRDPVVFGEDRDGARQLYNSQSGSSYSEKQSEIVLNCRYPYRFTPYTNEKITKILVLINEIDDGAKFDVNILDGGIGKSFVSLEVVAINSSKLQYRVKVFGVDSE